MDKIDGAVFYAVLGGVLACCGGIRLGVADPNSSFNLTALGMVWALVVPLLVGLSDRIGTALGNYRKVL